ncbi:MAG: response regulator [Phycisphaeraceae bacterium]|nr:response regulator [Phycisphaeraceae bacterium]
MMLVGKLVMNKEKNGDDRHPHRHRGSFNVLIADDEHLVATGIAGMVRDLGHTVVGVAPDGESAIELAHKHRPHLALLDIRMPGLTGPEVAVRLQDELSIPSVIISAYSDEEHLDRIRASGPASGVFGYLLKPIDNDELRVTISVAMMRAGVEELAGERIHQLEKNLTNRRTVEQAKWVLVEKHGMNETQAHDKLQRVARDQRRPLVEIAAEVIERGDVPA